MRSGPKLKGWIWDNYKYPLIFLAANSLRPYINKKPVIFFTEWHVENYYFAVAMIPFFKYLLNTMKLVVISVFGSLVMDFLMGYAFARLRAPGREMLFKLVLLQLMIPYIAIQIPQFVWYNTLGLMDTYWIFILNALGGSAYNIFLVKQFMSSFPRELDDAAKVDGCGFLRMIAQIVIPLSKPLYALFTLPVIILFFFFQKYLVQGIVTSGLKG